MKKIKRLSIIVLMLAGMLASVSSHAAAQDETPSFDDASQSVLEKLQNSVDELNRLSEQAIAEKVPLHQKLRKLESELLDVRMEYQNVSREFDSSTLKLSNLTREEKQLKDEAAYISNLLSDYIRKFESRLHIAEMQRYEDALKEAKLAAENDNLSEKDIYRKQVELLNVSLSRLQDALGGTRFEGTAVDSTGLVKDGTFIMIGPSALFLSEDGQTVGTVEQQLGSLKPKIVEFGTPEDSTAAMSTVTNSAGSFPLDPTLGNARKIEETEITFKDEFEKGGVVMYAIFGLAGAALLVAIFKWLSMSFVQTPSNKQTNRLLNAIAQNDQNAVEKEAKAINKMKPTFVQSLNSSWIFGAIVGLIAAWALKLNIQNLPSGLVSILDNRYHLAIFAASGAVVFGVIKFLLDRVFAHSPFGTMLGAGVEHIQEPRELIEEVMYEKVLAFRLKLDRLLPFIAISASAAPLLGLLGTVTGIINTFKLLTVFGSGDVKSLSGGISEALITTKWGLIVAIPSLLIHAFLSRRARGVINKMEKSAVTLVNQISKSDFRNNADSTPETATTETEVDQLLDTPVTPPAIEQPIETYADDSAGGIMNPEVFSVDKSDTVAEVINKMRNLQIGNDVDAVYIVDEQGKYCGHVLVHHLLTGAEHDPVESLANQSPLYVRVDTHKNDVQTLFNRHHLVNLPVVDHNGQLVGRITRNGNG